MNLALRCPSAVGGLGVLLSTLSCLAAEPQILQPVVVTATRTPQPAGAVLADVRVIDAQTLAGAGTMTLTELLQTHGGAEISANGGPGQVSGVFLRGSNASHVVLLIDGVRVNSATAGTNAFENLPLAQIERIEILRGPASSLYGADAIGGVIQVFTKQGTPQRTQAGVGAGTWATRQATAGLGRSFGATRMSLQAGYRESRSFSATNTGSVFSFDADDDPYRNSHLGLGVEHDWADGQTLALRALASHGTTHFDSGPGSDDLNRQRLAIYAFETRNRIGTNWRSLLRAARGRDDIRVEGSFPSRFATDQDQLTWQNDIGAFGGQVVAGLEWRREKVGSDTAYTQTTRSIRSLLGGYSASVGAHGVEASLRHDDNSQFGAQGTGRFAYGYQVTPAWRVSASVGTAFKAPSFNDLYYPLSFGFSGNPNLRPERARSAELAARYGAGGVQAGLTLFESRVRDLIAVDPGFTTVVNVNRARIRGATLAASAHQGIWLARAEWTHQNPADADTGHQLVRRARNHGSASLRATQGPWRGGAELTASGTRYDSASNSVGSRMGGYGLVNVHAAYAVTPEWSLSARLNNLADKHHELAQGYNPPGRNLFVALEYSAPSPP